MKRFWFSIVLMLLLLAACGPAETQPSDGETIATLTVEESSVEADIQTPTATDTVATATESEPAEEDSEASAPTDSDVAFPATNFADAALIRDSDYFKGAEEPVVEIIEYSDFQ